MPIVNNIPISTIPISTYPIYIPKLHSNTSISTSNPSASTSSNLIPDSTLSSIPSTPTLIPSSEIETQIPQNISNLPPNTSPSQVIQFQNVQISPTFSPIFSDIIFVPAGSIDDNTNTADQSQGTSRIQAPLINPRIYSVC